MTSRVIAKRLGDLPTYGLGYNTGALLYSEDGSNYQIPMTNFLTASKSFDVGFTITSIKEEIVYGGQRLVWTGTYPKTVPSGSTPDTTGGIGSGAWAYSNDSVLRENLRSSEEGFGISLASLENGGNGQHLQTFLSLDMLGIDGTGNMDVTAQLLSAFNLSNQLGLPLVQNSGRYRISGSTVFTSTAGFNFKGAVFVPDSNFTGYVLCTQTEVPVTYTSTSPVVLAINSATLSANDGVLMGIRNDTTLNGCAIFLQGADPLYLARGTTKYWFHNSRISNRGKMDDHLKYGVSAVTQCIALPVKKQLTEFHLPAWDFVNGPANNGIIRINNITRARVYGGAIYNRPLLDVSKDPVIISLNYVYDVRVEDLYDEYPSYPQVSGALAYAYTLNFNYCNRLHFKNCVAQGYGWGVVGGQLATNLTYTNCSLNRIDMHDPFMGYLKIIDCDLGSWGISVFGLGDMYLERVTIDLEDSFYGSYREVNGIINARPDFGGAFDGGVYIKDLTLVGDATAYRAAKGVGLPLFSSYSFNASTGNIPDGSPVEPWGFKEIVVDGLRCTQPLDVRRFDSIIKADSIQYTTYFPLSVKIKNADFNSGAVEMFNLRGWKIPKYNASAVGIYHTLTSRPTNFIEMTNISCAGFEMLRPYSSYDYHNFEMRITNLQNRRLSMSPPAAFYSDQVGRYIFTDCVMSVISDTTLSSSSPMTKYSTFEINGGIIDSGSSNPLVITYSSGYGTPVQASNVTFVGNYSYTEVTALNLNVAEFVSCSNCRFLSSTTQAYLNPALWLGTAGSSGVSTNFNVMRGNQLTIAVAITGASTTATSAVSAKIPGSSTAGHMGGSLFSDTAAASANYQLYLNSRGTKANIGKVMSSGSLTGIWLQ